MKDLNTVQDDIIRYLAGEMPPSERRQFEKDLEANPRIAQEVEVLRATQKRMADFEIPDMEIPPFDTLLIDDAAPIVSIRPQPETKPIYQMGWMRYAAGVAVLIGLLWVSDFRVQSAGNGVTLSFGEVKTPDATSPDQMKAMIAEVLAAQQEQTESQQASFQQDMMQQMAALQAGLDETPRRNVSPTSTSLSDAQMAALSDMMDQKLDARDVKLTNSLTTWSDGWQSQRREDLGLIRDAFFQVTAQIESQNRDDETILTNLDNTNNNNQ